MFVQHHMKVNPVTISINTSIGEALGILRKNSFRHLPVTDETKRLLGMVTDRDIRSAIPSSVLEDAEKKKVTDIVENTQVSSIMSTDIVTLDLFSTLDDASLLLDREKVGAMPVLDDQKRVLGIFSIRDLLRAYNTLFGLGEKGSSLVVLRTDGQPRPLSRIVQLLENHEVHFSRIVRSSSDAHQEGLIYIRVNTMNIHLIHALLQESGFTLESSYV